MKKLALLVFGLVAFLCVQPARADSSSCVTTGSTISCTGNLSAPENVFTESFVALGSSVTVQTFGFGGGTNAAGQVIPAGGFDSLVALFAGMGPTATILVSGGNGVVSADNLTLFSPGCPPAGTVLMGVTNVCGDNALVATVTPGLTYTLLLTDANFVPCAINPGAAPPCTNVLSTDPGQYGDFTLDPNTGVNDFYTCNFDSSGQTCITDTGNFAVDISPAATPEPATLLLLGSGLLGIGWGSRRRVSRTKVLKN